VSFQYASSPTIQERVALGLEINACDGGAIVPFPDGWDRDSLTETLAPAARATLSRLRSEGFEIARFDVYTDEEGRRIAGALRFDHAEKRKQVLPVRATRAVGINPRLEFRALEPPRPLYGLEFLAQSPLDQVMLVEGEKAVEGARLRFPGHLVTTWSGGAAGVERADLRILARREIVIWPDNDVTGRAAAASLGALLGDVGTGSIRVVSLPINFPTKWDLADALPETGHE
jgi:hypothetical protein